MSELNLSSTTGIIYIVLIIVGCLWGLNKLKGVYNLFAYKSEAENRQLASERAAGGKRRKLKRQRK